VLDEASIEKELDKLTASPELDICCGGGQSMDDTHGITTTRRRISNCRDINFQPEQIVRIVYFQASFSLR